VQLSPTYGYLFLQGISSHNWTPWIWTQDKTEYEGTKQSRQPTQGTARPPPIIITAGITLITTQREIKSIMRGLDTS
jgi:hypothetical protein